MGQQQLSHVGFPCQRRRHESGAVQLLHRHRGKGSVEGALHTQQIHPFNIRQETLRVARIGTVGIAAHIILATGFLLNQKTVCGYRVQQRKRRHSAEIILEQKLHSLSERKFMIAQFVVKMTARGLHQQLHCSTHTRWRVNIQRLLPSAQMHATHQPRQPEEMVAVQVGNENMRNSLHPLMIDTQLCLRVLTTVQKDAETVDVHHLPATVASHRGQCRTRTQYRCVEIHASVNSRNKR